MTTVVPLGEAAFEFFDEDREVKEAVAIGLQESLDLSGAIWPLAQEREHNLGAVAVRALNALLFVLTDRHSKGETLATLLTKIFVERYNEPPAVIGLFGFVR